jgi:hypothetical protein
LRQELSEPFLLIGDIENHIRALLTNKFAAQELADARDPGDPDRIIADLSFGGYVNLLKDLANWGRMRLCIDQGAFVEAVDHVRKIRNDVMHFDPEPIKRPDLEALRAFAQFLRDLVQLQATSRLQIAAAGRV